MRKYLGRYAAVAAMGLLAGAADAATITEDINFSLYGFVDIGNTGAPPPITLINGSITVTYDPTQYYDNDTADVVVHSLTGITSDSALGFTYYQGELEFGGIENDASSVYANTNDFVVAMDVADPAHPTLIPCSTPGYTCGAYTGSSAVGTGGYTQVGSNTGWFYSSGSIVSPTTIPAVPEPGSLALMAAGLAALCLQRGARRQDPV